MKFDHSQKNPELAKGKVLISEPFLADPNFERTVILLCEHNLEGSFGVVINKPVAEIKLSEILEEPHFNDFDVYLGGPVEQDALQFIHTISSLPKCIPLVNDLYLGGDFDHLNSLIDLGTVTKDDVRFFLGYSGWGPGQLNKELDENAWIVSDISSEEFFSDDPEGMWREVLKNMGGKFKIVSNFPSDPRLN